MNDSPSMPKVNKVREEENGQEVKMTERKTPKPINKGIQMEKRKQ